MSHRHWTLELLIEAVNYAAGSPRSRLRQIAALRELDDRLLDDVGITRRQALAGRPASARSRTIQRRQALPSARLLHVPERLMIR